ncbi:MAG: hypothetical protein B0A82_17350 [Alkalinema sp. CACIAM 70d]|nr:MAG: hypothetical protein B0A82_17350 [Alkalinema sp. CACIAM 70d]
MQEFTHREGSLRFKIKGDSAVFERLFLSSFWYKVLKEVVTRLLVKPWVDRGLEILAGGLDSIP